MLKKILRPILTVPVIFLFFSAYSQESYFRFMFYNVENLFDIHDDPLTDDNDFLPEGVMRWNASRYSKKINSLYKTIIAAGEWQPPGMIALSEIENRKVLEDLVTGTNLVKYDYGIIHEESPDERGIDVALLYRKDIVKLLSSKYCLPTGITGTRSILYARCLINKDTVDVFVNHWPSRRGGVLAGENDRIAIADMVRNKVDSITMVNAGVRIIIAGDFNCVPEDPAIKKITGNMNNILVNMAEKLSGKGEGTYRFQGTWELIDQVIISKGFLNSASGLAADGTSFKIFKPEFLLINDPKFPGSRPFSTYNGYRYQGGFSDHLPVLLDLFFR